MGHSKITTTERYLHARPLTELADSHALEQAVRAVHEARAESA
jgi:hypothetical protein